MRNFLASKFKIILKGMADVILVNSKFTSKIFRDTFRTLNSKKLEVLYPSLNTDKFDTLLNELSKQPEKESDLIDTEKENLKELERSRGKKFVFLSINRYERKKDLKLALKAMHSMKAKLSPELWEQCHLIMAGGYDSRVIENVGHYKELKEISDDLGLK